MVEKREVILACGAIKSPQLLELSGIGGRDPLNKQGIEVTTEFAHVEEHLQDHVLASIILEVAYDQVSGDVMKDSNIVKPVIRVYQDTQIGPLSDTPLSFAYTPIVDCSGATSPTCLATCRIQI